MNIKGYAYYREIHHEFLEADNDVVFPTDATCQTEIILSAIEDVIYYNLTTFSDVFEDFEVGDDIILGTKEFRVVEKELSYPTIRNMETFWGQPAIKIEDLKNRITQYLPRDQAKDRIILKDPDAITRRREADYHRTLANYFEITDKFSRTNELKLLVIGANLDELRNMQTPHGERLFKYIPARRLKLTGEPELFIPSSPRAQAVVYFASDYQIARQFLQDDDVEITHVLSVMNDLKPTSKKRTEFLNVRNHQLEFAQFMIEARKRDFKVITQPGLLAANLVLNKIDDNPMNELSFDAYNNGDVRLWGSTRHPDLGRLNNLINQVYENMSILHRGFTLFNQLRRLRSLLANNQAVFAIDKEKTEYFLSTVLNDQFLALLITDSHGIEEEIEDIVKDYLASLCELPTEIRHELKYYRNRVIVASEALKPLLASVMPGLNFIADRDYDAYPDYEDAIVFTSYSFEQIFWSFKFENVLLVSEEIRYFEYYVHKLQPIGIELIYHLESGARNDIVDFAEEEFEVDMPEGYGVGDEAQSGEIDYPQYEPLEVDRDYNYKLNAGSIKIPITSSSNSGPIREIDETTITHLLKGTHGEYRYSSVFATFPVIRNNRLIETKNVTVQVGDFLIETHIDSSQSYPIYISSHPDDPDVKMDQEWKSALDSLYARYHHVPSLLAEWFGKAGFDKSITFFTNWSSTNRPIVAQDPEFIKTIGRLSGNDNIYQNYLDYHDASYRLRYKAKQLEVTNNIEDFEVIRNLLSEKPSIETLKDELFERDFVFMEIAEIEELPDSPQNVKVNEIQNFHYVYIHKEPITVNTRRSHEEIVASIAKKTGYSLKRSRWLAEAILVNVADERRS
jgi:hypothetical protein